MSTGTTSATEIFMQGLVCQAWNSKPEDPLPSAVVRREYQRAVHAMVSHDFRVLLSIWWAYTQSGFFGCNFYVFVH